MFERLGQLEKSVMSRKAFEFAQTHPASENRVKVCNVRSKIENSSCEAQTSSQYLEAALPEAYQIVESNPECAEVRRQLDAFRETAHQVKIDEIPGLRFGHS